MLIIKKKNFINNYMSKIGKAYSVAKIFNKNNQGVWNSRSLQMFELFTFFKLNNVETCYLIYLSESIY